jgi:hypothetical protein
MKFQTVEIELWDRQFVTLSPPEGPPIVYTTASQKISYAMEGLNEKTEGRVDFL